ncbi:hypothetical protein ACFL5O_07755 [Myxococcota bacterium]
MFLLAYHAPSGITDPAATTATVGHNEWSLARLGHLFFAEARNAGFSYALLEDPSVRNLRDSEFRVENYNVYRDAADLWQVLLGFLDRHSELAASPVYFLAESYGALRVTVMISFALNALEYASGQREFLAPQLFERLASFEQVRGQILLQPWFAGRRQAAVTGELLEQSGSVLDRLAAAAGTSYVRCGEQGDPCDPYANARALLETMDRSAYDIRAGSDWLNRHTDLVVNAATQRESLASLLGVGPELIDPVLGGDRTQAYRFADPGHSIFSADGHLEQAYGAVRPWDAYLVPLNGEAHDVFVSEAANANRANSNQSDCGELFLDNLRVTPTFMSRAEFDLVIFGPSLAPVLASYPKVTSASLVNTTWSEQIEVEFADRTTRTFFLLSTPAPILCLGTSRVNCSETSARLWPRLCTELEHAGQGRLGPDRITRARNSSAATERARLQRVRGGGVASCQLAGENCQFGRRTCECRNNRRSAGTSSVCWLQGCPPGPPGLFCAVVRSNGHLGRFLL